MPDGPVVELNLSDEDRDWRELGWDPDQMSRDTSGATCRSLPMR